MPQISPLALANTFIQLHGEADGIEHMKLQKLAFYSYGWWLASEDQPLLTEGPELWRFGPVFSSLYSALAQFGARPIKAAQRPTPFGPIPLIPEEDVRTRAFVDWIWGRYGGYSSFRLSDLTHSKGSPWQQEAEARNYRVPLHHRIPDDTIRKYFKDEAAKLAPA